MHDSGKLSSGEAIAFDKFTLFPAARSLEFEGAPIAVGSRAIEILILLAEHAGTVVSKKDLIARAWPHATVDEGGLKVQIASLRRILRDGQNGNRYIATVNGRGYCFVAPTERRDRTRYAAVPRRLSTPVLKYRLVAIVDEVVAALEGALRPVAQNDNDGAGAVSGLCASEFTGLNGT